VILLFAVALAALSAWATGGSLGNLAKVTIRARGTIVAALALQVLIISVIPRQSRGWTGQGLELASYALAIVFLFANRKIPWLWLVGLGGLANLAAIGANEGVMPASRLALRAAGIVRHTGEFLNSTSLPSPHLAFLGDNFSIPRSWPIANVFSAGDVVLAVGAVLLLHWVCDSRPARAARRRVSPGALEASEPGPGRRLRRSLSLSGRN
jgi:hypothetical protein